jgi:iron complex transport system permease protein
MTADVSRTSLPLPVVYGGLVALTVAGLLLSLAVGRGGDGPILGWQSPIASIPEGSMLLLMEIRLPRALLGLLVGGTLGLCGAALQGLLRNPLAEPGLLGASSGAAFGAVVVFYFGLAGTTTLLLPMGGVVGSIAALLVLYGLSHRSDDMLTLILAGIAINAFAGAATSLALNFAPSPYAALEILFWMLGSLADRSLDHVVLVAPLMLAGWILVILSARGLDALTLGAESARSLGFEPRRTQLLVVSGTALAVGAAVAVTGVVGFVGLVVPHLLRGTVGFLPSRLLLPSFLGGAALTLIADTGIRLMPPGPELKLGVVTALVGAPFFLHLILRSRRGEL